MFDSFDFCLRNFKVEDSSQEFVWQDSRSHTENHPFLKRGLGFLKFPEKGGGGSEFSCEKVGVDKTGDCSKKKGGITNGQ